MLSMVKIQERTVKMKKDGKQYESSSYVVTINKDIFNKAKLNIGDEVECFPIAEGVIGFRKK